MDTKYLLHSGANSTCYYPLVFQVKLFTFSFYDFFLNHVTDFLIVFSYQGIVNLQCSISFKCTAE